MLIQVRSNKNEQKDSNNEISQIQKAIDVATALNIPILDILESDLINSSLLFKRDPLPT